MAVDLRFDPEMSVVRDWNSHGFSVGYRTSHGFGLQPLPKGGEVASEGKDHETNPENRHPGGQHLHHLADRHARGDERARNGDQDDHIIERERTVVVSHSWISSPSCAGAAQSGSSATSVW